MKILLFSDIHNDWKRLEELLAIEADLYIAAGDGCTWNKGIDRYGEILGQRGAKVHVLPGNHESADKVAAICERNGLHYFHEKDVKVGRWHLAGLGYSNPTPFNTPSEYSEPQIAEHLQPFASLSPMVLVCHAPPYGTALDQVHAGLHAGSRSVLEFIEKQQPELFFCGHIHEAEGRETVMGRTHGRNVGKAGHLLELD